MQKLAVSSGTVVFESNSQIVVAKKPSQWTTTFMFVSGLVTLITLVNGVLQILLGATATISITLLGIGSVFLAITILVARHRKKVNSIPWNELDVICKLDFEKGKVLDDRGQILCDLSEAKLKRQMQLTSSSSALVLIAGNRKIKLVNGSPFTGGVSAVNKVLLERGIKMK